MLPFLILGMVAGELFLRPSKAAETATTLKGVVDDVLLPAPQEKNIVGFSTTLTTWEEIDCWHSGLEALKRNEDCRDEILVQQWISLYTAIIAKGHQTGRGGVDISSWPARDREKMVAMALLLIKKGFK